MVLRQALDRQIGLHLPEPENLTQSPMVEPVGRQVLIILCAHRRGFGLLPDYHHTTSISVVGMRSKRQGSHASIVGDHDRLRYIGIPPELLDAYLGDTFL